MHCPCQINKWINKCNVTRCENTIWNMKTQYLSFLFLNVSHCIILDQFQVAQGQDHPSCHVQPSGTTVNKTHDATCMKGWIQQEESWRSVGGSCPQGVLQLVRHVVCRPWEGKSPLCYRPYRFIWSVQMSSSPPLWFILNRALKR